jgi:hypothetical protein
MPGIIGQTRAHAQATRLHQPKLAVHPPMCTVEVEFGLIERKLQYEEGDTR